MTRLRGSNATEKVAQAYVDRYRFITFKVWYEASTSNTVIEARISHPIRKVQWWNRSVRLADYALMAAEAPAELIRANFESLVKEVVHAVPEEEIGAYPFARMWHDQHAIGETRILWKPGLAVPGWVFPKAYKVFPRDASSVKKPKKESAPVELVKENVKFDKMKEALDMAAKTTTKKKRIVRAPIKGFDPTKVKAPECPIHKSPMAFDAVEQKWRCNNSTCNQVARPKRDADDKTVILGKGSVQLRLVAQLNSEGILERSVVLISDDNVALNITKMIDIDELIDNFDVESQAKVASDSGKEVFNVPEHSIPLHAGLVVMGASDLRA